MAAVFKVEVHVPAPVFGPLITSSWNVGQNVHCTNSYKCIF